MPKSCWLHGSGSLKSIKNNIIFAISQSVLSLPLDLLCPQTCVRSLQCYSMAQWAVCVQLARITVDQ